MTVQAINRSMALAQVVFKLGLTNVARVVIYKTAIKLGYFRWKCPVAVPIEGSFFTSDTSHTGAETPNTINYFSAHPIKVEGAPKWFVNPWMKSSNDCRSAKHWSHIPDFSKTTGDIKTIWEPSRFDWMPQLAWQASSGDNRLSRLATLEIWMRDWLANNPPNQGINWKCAQEVSLRALNVLMSYQMLQRQMKCNTDSFAVFFAAHIERVLPTTLYAKAQNNNHGTTEAVALFCIGLFLLKHGNTTQQTLGQRSVREGRKFLENRVRKLVLYDGSFSQLSVNYHRLMLDTITYCELVRRDHQVAQFTPVFYSRMRSATHWLAAMTDVESGDAANIGANDGACFANLENHPYRDFRPTLNRSLIVFCDRKIAYPRSDALLDSHAVVYQHLAEVAQVNSCHFPEGGFARINLPRCNGHFIFRYPKYAFRPPNCDANHLDIWVNGQNLTLDAGSYSYNTENEQYRQYFAGTAGHCTIKFDERDQMPRLGRMLRGFWLSPELSEYNAEQSMVLARYTDYLGAWHQRKVSATDYGLHVRDEFGGFSKNAVLRWRLPDLQWQINAGTVRSSIASISVNSSASHQSILCQEKNSLHYLKLEDVVVFKTTLSEPGTVDSHFHLYPDR